MMHIFRTFIRAVTCFQIPRLSRHVVDQLNIGNLKSKIDVKYAGCMLSKTSAVQCPQQHVMLICHVFTDSHDIRQERPVFYTF